MSKKIIDDLMEILPKLIRENDTVRGVVLSALSGVVATHEGSPEEMGEITANFRENNCELIYL